MPAAVVKGIILSISLIAALGIAVLENPQVQEWLEEQRRKVAELLRQIGQELDPESRRAAEAFAFEGRTIVNDAGLRREASGSQEAAALATGRSLSNPSTIRRIPIPGHVSDPSEAEERRRKGREYLARRNQQMYELQRRRNAAQADRTELSSSPTFDSLVDDEGKLKAPMEEEEKEMPSPPRTQLQPNPIREEMREMDRSLTEPLLGGESSSAGASGWNMGSYFANPFGDEYALERSITPKPPVPPKIELDRVPSPPISVPERAATPPISLPGTYEALPTDECQQVDQSQLSYEEQLAIALSLSEQETTTNSATVRQNDPDNEDDAILAAIAASLKDMDHQQAAHAIAHAEPSTPQPIPMDAHPLVDLTPSTPPTRPRNIWEGMFGPQPSPSREPLTLPPSITARSEASDDLYSATPELTRASLAHFDAQQVPAIPSTISSLPFDPVRDAALSSPQPVRDIMDASFYSAADIAASPESARSRTLDRATPHLIDVDEEVPREGARTPTSRAQSSWGFQTDSDSETFASMSAPPSRAQSPPRSEASTIEVIDLAEDSDVDMLSEEGDGIATPDSWSEVGSRDAESDTEDDTTYTRQQSGVTS